jgi:steroid delta-isomerase
MRPEGGGISEAPSAGAIRYREMTNTERFLSYIHHYETKNVEKISEMFADDITLRDWKILVTGKTAALAETRLNFDAARSIQIQTLRLYEATGSIVGELKIVVDGSIELFVVDVVDFDSEGRIKSIRAFLGRGG